MFHLSKRKGKLVLLSCLFSLLAVFLAFQVSEPDLLESTHYEVGFQSKYCPKRAIKIKEDKKRQLQKTHGRATVTHGRAVIPEGTHGWTHDRASNRACLTRRTAARACWHGRASSRTARF